MIAEAVSGFVEGPFGFSRALAPKLREVLRRLHGSNELPFVRGRTVIPTDYGNPVVVGHPNHLGAFERDKEATLICLTGQWSALRRVPGSVQTIAIARPHSVGDAERALENARTLAKHMRQLTGVHLAFKPQSPILVLLLPLRIDRGVLPEGADVLDGPYPELPGGLRIELTPDMTTMDVTRYASILEQIITREA